MPDARLPTPGEIVRWLTAFALTLPHTAPKPVEAGAERFAWLEAIRLLRTPFILILWIVTFIDSFVHNCYFNWTGRFLPTVGIPGNWVTPVMSIGQVAEVLTMAILGACLKRLGWRMTMVLGILGHAARFAVFSFCGDESFRWLIVAVNILHGVCYAFFFATLYIFIDAAFPKDVRTSAQGLFNLLVLGVGDLTAKWLFIPLTAKYTVDNVTDFKSLFLIPTGLAFVGAIILAVAFWPPKSVSQHGEPSAPAH